MVFFLVFCLSPTPIEFLWCCYKFILKASTTMVLSTPVVRLIFPCVHEISGLGVYIIICTGYTYTFEKRFFIVIISKQAGVIAACFLLFLNFRCNKFVLSTELDSLILGIFIFVCYRFFFLSAWAPIICT